MNETNLTVKDIEFLQSDDNDNTPKGYIEIGKYEPYQFLHIDFDKIDYESPLNFIWSCWDMWNKKENLYVTAIQIY